MNHCHQISAAIKHFSNVNWQHWKFTTCPSELANGLQFLLLFSSTWNELTSMNNFANSTKKSIFAILVLFSAKYPFSKQKFQLYLLKWWKQILVAESWTTPRTPIACIKMNWEKEWNFYIIKKSLCECINEIVENTYIKKITKKTWSGFKG